MLLCISRASENLIKMFLIYSDPSDKGGKRFTALDDINLYNQSREVLGVIGRNGSGKIYSITCISGIYQPDEGKIQSYQGFHCWLALGTEFEMGI